MEASTSLPNLSPRSLPGIALERRAGPEASRRGCFLPPPAHGEARGQSRRAGHSRGLRARHPQGPGTVGRPQQDTPGMGIPFAVGSPTAAPCAQPLTGDGGGPWGHDGPALGRAGDTRSAHSPPAPQSCINGHCWAGSCCCRLISSPAALPWRPLINYPPALA